MRSRSFAPVTKTRTISPVETIISRPTNQGLRIFVSKMASMEEASKRVAHKIVHGSKGMLETEELYEYVLENSVYPREPKVLKELRDVTASHPMNRIATSADEGPFLALLLDLINAKKTIEIGVFTGYSLLRTALSIPDDGKIIAIDPDRKAYEIGLPIIKKAGVEHKIDFVESLALPVLDKLLEDKTNEGSFDFAYVDGDKVNYWNYHERLLKLVRVGGLILFDNTLWAGAVVLPEEAVPDFIKDTTAATHHFNKSVGRDPRVQICHVTLGDGVTVCRRLY